MAINFKKELKKGKPSTKLTDRLNPKKNKKDIVQVEKLNVYREGVVYELLIKDIFSNPDQPRKEFNEEKLQELSNSIKKHGIIQPAVVQINKNAFTLIAGERRLRAAKLAGVTTLSCIIKNTDKQAELALIENIQRENLKPIEEAEGYLKLKNNYNYTDDVISKIVGKSRNNITETLSLNKLPKLIKKECLCVDISKRILIQLAREKDTEKAINHFNKIKSGTLDYDQLIKKVKKRSKKKSTESPACKIVKKLESINNAILKLSKEDVLDEEKALIVEKFKNTKKIMFDVFAIR